MSARSRNSEDIINEILASGGIPDQLGVTVSELVSRGTDRDHVLALLEAYLRHPEWETEFEHALATEEEFTSLSGRVSNLISDGADAEQVRFRLEAFHLQLAGQGRDHDDDVVLEVLDELVGFSGTGRVGHT